jgi:hypothetical protein
MRFGGTTMAPRFLTILTGHNLPKIQESREPEPSIINEKTVADLRAWLSRRGFWNASPGLNKARSPED